MVTAWLGHMGRAWTGEPSDVAAALQHVQQAIQYLLRVCGSRVYRVMSGLALCLRLPTNHLLRSHDCVRCIRCTPAVPL